MPCEPSRDITKCPRALLRADCECIHRLTLSFMREKDILQAIMESTHTHIAYLDSDFTFVRVNQAYVEGSDVDQPWRGTTYWDWTLVPVKDSGQSRQDLSRAPCTLPTGRES